MVSFLKLLTENGVFKMSKDVECPYCDAEIEINHDDGFGYDESMLHHYECPECEKGFVFNTSISITHSAYKADCLNDDKHEYVETKTYPKRYTQLECKCCGDRKPISQERLEEFIALEIEETK